MRDANQFMFCGLQIPNAKTIGWGRGCMPSSQERKPKPINEGTKLNCVALRSQLDYEVAWRPVKGRDERQKTAPLTALHATREFYRDVGKKKERPPTSALTFYDLLIEALKFRLPRGGRDIRTIATPRPLGYALSLRPKEQGFASVRIPTTNSTPKGDIFNELRMGTFLTSHRSRRSDTGP